MNEKIKYCPVCGNKNIHNKEIESEDNSKPINYFCNYCGSNGILLITKGKV